MGNWDIVMPYDERATVLLAKDGLPHPAIRPGNRAPTTRELGSIDCTGVTFDVWGTDDVPDTVRVRGESYEAELRVIYSLARLCGQQWIYPDSGAPSIVVDPEVDFAKALRVWQEANEREDGWEWLYRELYG